MEPEFVGSLIASMDALRARGHELCEWGYVKNTFVRTTVACCALDHCLA
jgi:hypothetical protein